MWATALKAFSVLRRLLCWLHDGSFNWLANCLRRLLSWVGNPIFVKSGPDRDVFFGWLHGLLTGDSGWQRNVATWGAINTPYSHGWLSYEEGLLGAFHQQHVNALASAVRTEQKTVVRPRENFHGVGHSNGCRLWLEMLAQNPDILLGDLHLIAAWALRDCDKNNLNLILSRPVPQALRVFLYVSTGDDVLGMNDLTVSYFDMTLGKDGPTNLKAQAVSIGQDNSYSHCGWVDGPSPLGFNFKTIDTVISISAPMTPPNGGVS